MGLRHGLQRWRLPPHSEIQGHLFAQEGAEVSGHNAISHACLSSSASLRDNNPTAVLTNLIWNARGQHQCFQFGPRDVQKVGLTFHQDANAQIFVITGVRLVPLSRSGRRPSRIYSEAISLQAIEWVVLSALHVGSRKASVQMWSLAEVYGQPASGHACCYPPHGPKFHKQSYYATGPYGVQRACHRSARAQKSGYAPGSGRGFWAATLF